MRKETRKGDFEAHGSPQGELNVGVSTGTRGTGLPLEPSYFWEKWGRVLLSASDPVALNF